MEETIPSEVLTAWELEAATLEPVSVGLINRTLIARRPGGPRLVLQRLHPVFGREVNLDIEAVTTHLAARGVLTPLLVRTVDGRPWVEAPDGLWRAQTFVEGRTVERVAVPETAAAAARVAAGFHGALRDLDWRFRFTRAGVHDTRAHLAALREALSAHADHPDHGEVRPVAEAILRAGERAPALPELPARVIHGDLKISNVLFDDTLRQGRALVDLDTMARGSLAVEMGDALRSWCNPRGEDDPAATLDEAIFGAAVRSYLGEARGWIEEEEARSFVAGTEIIAVELAARFCADALAESYFGWDPRRFPSRSAHNLSRARSQLGVARSVAKARTTLDVVVTDALKE